MDEISTRSDREKARDGSMVLEYVTVEYEDAPSACTMYPRDCSEADLATHWLTAREGAFVDLAEMR